jgi:Auxiliary Activity family 9 (formerly GH61)
LLAGKGTVNFPIPKCLADGEYLFRIEHNALHQASKAGGAQFYISCAQIKVTGGTGSKSPTGLVAFPGAYTATDPGIMVNIYTSKTYTPAGPAVFTC